MPVGGRVSGKVGIYSNVRRSGHHSGINEEIIWVSIGMAVTIAILITIALCYIAREKWRRHKELRKSK
ncbi:uncharacterized protein LOC113210234 [Frankliniella occidentalis]|uniref:Uncharacterized protein LOC113210234 n=1 Tax=Frankliniella occidentalis TaxID=133901 RepID=A0A6J1SX24_FRAOC|nr:uncharacterized protein LOC113210234 [Frankliniella occidentalis]